MRPDEKGKKLANDILDYVNNLACNEEIGLMSFLTRLLNGAATRD